MRPFIKRKGITLRASEWLKKEVTSLDDEISTKHAEITNLKTQLQRKIQNLTSEISL